MPSRPMRVLVGTKQSSKMISEVAEDGSHLVLFLADGDARRISINSENSQPTNAARLTGIGKECDFVTDRRIGDEALRTIQDIAAIDLFCLTGYRTCIRACSRFRQRKAGDPTVVQAVEVFLFLFIAALVQRIGRKRMNWLHKQSQYLHSPLRALH